MSSPAFARAMTHHSQSHAKQLAVARLNRLAVLLDRGGILFHGFDLVEWLAPVGFLGLRMQGSHLADIYDQLLALLCEAVALEQPRSVGIRCGFEDAVRTDNYWYTFGWIDDLDRSFLGLDEKQIVFVAVSLHGTFAKRELLGRIGRGLDLHHPLLGELLEILPTKVARHLLGCSHDGAAITGMRLDHLAGPFRIEQIGKAL